MALTPTRDPLMTPSYFTPSLKQSVPIYPVTAADLPERLAQCPSRARAWVKAQSFTAKPDSFVVLPGADGTVEAVLAGIEGAPHIWSLAHLPAALPAGKYRIEAEWSDDALTEAALGFALAQYQFGRYKPLPRKQLLLALPKSVDVAAIKQCVEAIFLTRDLINTPANDMGPEELAAAAKTMAANHGARFREIVGEALLSQNYPAIHAVGRAAEQEPRLIELTYGKKSDPLVVLVGKGVTFDTGGLDIKPYASMKMMKKDMGGAALVLGLAS